MMERPKEVLRTFLGGVANKCAEHLMCACFSVLHTCSQRVQHLVPHFLQVIRTLSGEVFLTAVQGVPNPPNPCKLQCVEMFRTLAESVMHAD